MTTTYPRECARCGQNKPPWFKYCPKCYAIVQTEQLKPNTCDEQDCDEVIDDEHYLCRTHWQQFREAKISECPECGEYKPKNYPLCRRCNTQSDNQPARQSKTNQPQGTTPKPQASNIRIALLLMRTARWRASAPALSPAAHISLIGLVLFLWQRGRKWTRFI